MNILTASKARKIAEETIQDHVTQELSSIDKKIMESCKNGKTRCSFSGSISSVTRKELERCGYKVETGSQYNESYVIITW